MVKRIFIVLLAVFLGMTLAVNGDEGGKSKQKLKKEQQLKEKKKEQPASIKWMDDITKALAAAKKSKKHIVLVYIAPEVNQNSKLFNEFISRKEFAKFANAAVFVKFEYKDMKNISKNAQAAAKKYPVGFEGNQVVMPTVYIIDSTGKVVDRKVGFKEADVAFYMKQFKTMKSASVKAKKKSKKK